MIEGVQTASLRIEYLHLDLSQCGRCQSVLRNLTAAIDAARPALTAMGVSPDLALTHVTSAEQARAIGFVASRRLLRPAELAVDQRTNCGR